MKKWGLAIALTALIAALPTRADAAGFPALFDTVGHRNASLEALPQWGRVLNEIAAEKSLYQACSETLSSCESKALLAWQAMMKSQSGQSDMAKMRAVNRFINQWAHQPDIINHAQQDFWASPLTFLRQSGDCEDYAIVKYVSLREMGFAADQLRIVVVHDKLRDQAHAVLAVHIDNDVYVLDNLFQAVLPQARVSQYQPHYSVNEQARWLHLPSDSLMVSSAPEAIMPGAGPEGDVIR